MLVALHKMSTQTQTNLLLSVLMVIGYGERHHHAWLRQGAAADHEICKCCQRTSKAHGTALQNLIVQLGLMPSHA